MKTSSLVNLGLHLTKQRRREFTISLSSHRCCCWGKAAADRVRKERGRRWTTQPRQDGDDCWRRRRHQCAEAWVLVEPLTGSRPRTRIRRRTWRGDSSRLVEGGETHRRRWRWRQHQNIEEGEEQAQVCVSVFCFVFFFFARSLIQRGATWKDPGSCQCTVHQTSDGQRRLWEGSIGMSRTVEIGWLEFSTWVWGASDNGRLTLLAEGDGRDEQHYWDRAAGVFRLTWMAPQPG
jgi:hypothetical protein